MRHIFFSGRTTDNQKNTDTLSKTLAALEALVSLHQQQFQEYRLESAEKYVTQAAMTVSSKPSAMSE